MALVKWWEADNSGTDTTDDNSDQNTLSADSSSDTTTPSITPIKSVQSSWQPSDNTFSASNGGSNSADFGSSSENSSNSSSNSSSTPQNYLMSDAHEQVDNFIQQRAQQEEAQRQAAAAAAAAAARAAAARAAAARQEKNTETGTPQLQSNGLTQAQIAAQQNDNSWKKYYAANFAREKSRMNWIDDLLDNGRASQRAEQESRAQATWDLLKQAYNENGQTINQDAANKAKIAAAYNLAVSRQQDRAADAAVKAITPTHTGTLSDFLSRLNATANAIKQINVYDAVVGGVSNLLGGNTVHDDVNDGNPITPNNWLRDISGAVQYIATSPITGIQSIANAVTGRGTDATTGNMSDLTPLQRTGDAISGVVDLATPFIGGGGEALKTTEGAAKSAGTSLAKRSLDTGIQQAAMSGAQSAGDYFGNGGTLTDNDGNLDQSKLGALASSVGENAAIGGAIGGLVPIGGKVLDSGVRAISSRLTPKIAGALDSTAPELADSADKRLTTDIRKQTADGDMAKPTAETPAEGPSVPADELHRGGQGIDDVTPVRQPGLVDKTPVTQAPGTAPRIPSSVPADNVDAHLKYADYQRDLRFEKMASETKSGVSFDHPDMYVNPTPEMYDNLKKPTAAPKVDQITPNINALTSTTDLKPADAGNVAKSKPTIDTNDVTATPSVGDLQSAKAGATQAEEAKLNQAIANKQAEIPSMASDATVESSNLLNELTGNGAEAPKPKRINSLADLAPGETMSKADADRIAAKRLMPNISPDTQMKSKLAYALGQGQDAASSVSDILAGANVEPKTAARLASLFDKLDDATKRYNDIQKSSRLSYKNGGQLLDQSQYKTRSAIERNELKPTLNRIADEIRHMKGTSDFKNKLVDALEKTVSYRNANVLIGSRVSKDWIQAGLGATQQALETPVKFFNGLATRGDGSVIKGAAGTMVSPYKALGSEIKSQVGDFRYHPIRGLVNAVPNTVKDTYKAVMGPASGAEQLPGGAIRTALAKRLYHSATGLTLSDAEAGELAGSMGNMFERLVHMGEGSLNGMTSRFAFRKALAAADEYMLTGSDAARTAFEKSINGQGSGMVDQLLRNAANSDEALNARALKAGVNAVTPFVNAAKNSVVNPLYDLRPRSQSIVDEILSPTRGAVVNAAEALKHKIPAYGIPLAALGAAAGGNLVYNNGDQVDKPAGYSFKMSDGTYRPIRETPWEFPIAAAATAGQAIGDAAKGKFNAGEYAGRMAESLPYVSQLDQNGNAMSTINDMINSDKNGDTSGNDNGYALKNFGVSSIKSLIPFSNNGVQAAINGAQGKSTDARKVYDPNFGTWLGNSIKNAYGQGGDLPISRDAAGRARTVDTVDLTGAAHKNINDANTANYNNAINQLYQYSKDHGYSTDLTSAFSTYNQPNSHFHNIEGAIAGLGMVNGKVDSSTALQSNSSLADLSNQIKDGFYNGKGNNLLTLNGKTLSSDASVANKTGAKNSALPIDMQSITNAVAQAGLSKTNPQASQQLYDLSQQQEALYQQLKNKQISYDQYNVAKNSLYQQQRSTITSTPGYAKLKDFMDTLDSQGFFDANGMGSTRAGQNYFWNTIDAMIGKAGKTPAANYPDDTSNDKNWNSWGGRGKKWITSGFGNTNKPGARADTGIQWGKVGSRSMANVSLSNVTPVKIGIKLGNGIKNDKTQDYAGRKI